MINKTLKVLLFLSVTSFVIVRNFRCLIADGFVGIKDCYSSGFGFPRNEYLFWTEVLASLFVALIFLIGNERTKGYKLLIMPYLVFFILSFEFYRSFSNPYHFFVLTIHLISFVLLLVGLLRSSFSRVVL